MPWLPAGTRTARELTVASGSRLARNRRLPEGLGADVGNQSNRSLRSGVDFGLG